MQKFLAKYALAAHLALLAAAPLFLFPFCRESSLAVVYLWLSLISFLWCFLSPSVHSHEMLHQARRRAIRGALLDPVCWSVAVLVVFSGLRALNGGVRMAYSCETSAWSLASASCEFFPGCVTGFGDLPFAASVALLVLMIGIRHSLGRSARMAFLHVSGSLVGLAAVVIVWLAAVGDSDCMRVLSLPTNTLSYPGVTFGLYFLGAIAMMVTGFVREWNVAMITLPLSVGGAALGTFAFAPPLFSGFVAVAALVMLAFSFFVAYQALRHNGEFKLLVVFAVSMAIGVLLSLWLLPEKVMSARLAPFVDGVFFDDGFFALRRTLSAIAFRAWKGALWVGTGIGSFAIDIRFQAERADWALIPRGQLAVPNGGWMMLVELGLVGTVALAIPFALLVVSYIRSLVAWVREISCPNPTVLLAPAVVLLLAYSICFDCSSIRADVMIAAGALIAISAKSFPKTKGNSHG